jgi:hypothetical protein
MVKQRKKNSRKRRSSKGFRANRAKASKINGSTPYETCTEKLSSFDDSARFVIKQCKISAFYPACKNTPLAV